MKKMGLLKFEDLYSLQSNLLTYDCFHGNAPKNITNLVTKTLNPNLNLRNQTNNPLDLKIPNMKSRAGSHSFSFKGPSLWNEVSGELRATNHKEKFKRAIKRQVLEGYDKKAVCTNPRCKDNSNHSCIG